MLKVHNDAEWKVLYLISRLREPDIYSFFLKIRLGVLAVVEKSVAVDEQLRFCKF